MAILEDNDDGAVGVVLNRPTDEEITGPLERWLPHQSDPAVLFYGGPVEPDALIALANTTEPVDASHDEMSRVSDTIASADLSTDPVFLTNLISKLRVFRGYAGWAPGQLNAELSDGAWIVVDSDPDDIFSAHPDDLWRQVLRRQPGRLSWLANAPDDLSLN